MAEIAIEHANKPRLRAEAETARRLIDGHLGDRSDVDRVTTAAASDDAFCVSVEGDRIWCADTDGWIDAMAAVSAVRRQLAGLS